MCIKIFDWFNDEILILFSQKEKNEKKKVEPLIKIIIDEIREEPKLDNSDLSSWDVL